MVLLSFSLNSINMDANGVSTFTINQDYDCEKIILKSVCKNVFIENADILYIGIGGIEGLDKNVHYNGQTARTTETFCINNLGADTLNSQINHNRVLIPFGSDITIAVLKNVFSGTPADTAVLSGAGILAGFSADSNAYEVTVVLELILVDDIHP